MRTREEKEKYVPVYSVCIQETLKCICAIEILIVIGRAMLLEQYNQRTHEAHSLASEVLTGPPILLSPSQPEGAPMTSTTRSTSAHRYLMQQ